MSAFAACRLGRSRRRGFGVGFLIDNGSIDVGTVGRAYGFLLLFNIRKGIPFFLDFIIIMARSVGSGVANSPPGSGVRVTASGIGVGLCGLPFLLCITQFDGGIGFLASQLFQLVFGSLNLVLAYKRVDVAVECFFGCLVLACGGIYLRIVFRDNLIELVHSLLPLGDGECLVLGGLDEEIYFSNFVLCLVDSLLLDVSELLLGFGRR